MPSPLGHSLASLAFCSYRTEARSVKMLVCAQIAGNAPDIDILFSLLLAGDLTTFHHLYTHNAFFPALLAIPLAMYCGRSLRAWIFFTAMGWVHCLFDALIGWPILSGPTDGIPFFWPISDSLIPGYIALFPPLHFGVEDSIWDWRNLLAIGCEFIIFGLLCIVLWIRRLLGYNRPVNLSDRI